MKHIINNGETIQITLARLTDTTVLRELTDEILSVVKNENLKTITLDMSQVTSIASAGLGVFLTLRKVAPLTLRKVNDDIRTILKVTRLDTLFAIE